MSSQEIGSQEERLAVLLDGFITNKVIPMMKIVLGIFFIFQITFQLCTSLKYFIRYGYGFDVFLPTILTFLAIWLGELGRRQSRPKFLRLYLVLSYLAMILLFSTKRERLVVDFDYGEDSLNHLRILNKILAMILEMAMPFGATIITLPVIHILSSSSRSTNMRSN